MINMEIINMDLDEKRLIDIANYIVDKETIRPKEINDLISSLDIYNITVRFNNVNMMQYTLLLTMKGINANIIKQKEIKFNKLNIEDEEIVNEYNRLLDKYLDLRERLDMFSDVTLEALEPGSRLVDVELNMSLRDFIVFIKTCSKYDELIELVLAISGNKITQSLIMAIYKLELNSQDIYMRLKVDDNIRNDLLSITNDKNIFVLSNIDNVTNNLVKGNLRERVAVIGYANYLQIRDLLNKGIDLNIKLENPKLIEKEEHALDVITTDELELLSGNEELANEVDKYIYDWICLIDKIKHTDEYYYNDIVSCHLGCFANVYAINNNINDYLNLRSTDIGNNIVEILYTLVQNI